ncbi:GGDEF domain-containing protein [Granulosicoccaceae sp. 1_MG-2023]|nr:GGDEF domain-containing protein [Granulosicoccaceae sp. 1_MG-2023]
MPSPPAVAARIIELSASSASTLGDVADAVSIDPALSAKLLRMANSPLYARQRKVENLRQAILLFGIEGTLNIALSFSLKNSSGRRGNGLDYNEYWKRSLASALLCQEFGRRYAEVSKDSLFLIGLLQDIGVIALDKASPEIYRDMHGKELSHRALCQRELEYLGEDHAMVGAWLLNEWNLPQAIIDPIAKSHQSMDQADQRNLSSISRCVAAASILADIFVAGEIDRCLNYAVKTISGFLSTSNDEFHEIIDTVTANFTDMASMFDIELYDSTLADEIMAQAKEILIMRNLSHDAPGKDKQATDSNPAVPGTADRDPATGLANRTFFKKLLAQEFENSRKYEWPLGVILLSPREFSQLNANYGTGTTDAMLRHIAALLEQTMRDTDTCSRFCSEEFAVLLPGIDKHGMEIACQRLLSKFSETPLILPNGKQITQDICVGAAVCYGESYYNKPEQLLSNVEEALYEARRNDGNRYCLFSREERITPMMLTGS